MKIESKRLILRNWEDGDVKDIVDGLNNLEVAKCMAGVPFPYTENDARNFIERAKKNDENVKIALAIVLKENNKVIGGTEIRNINKMEREEIEKKSTYSFNNYREVIQNLLKENL